MAFARVNEPVASPDAFRATGDAATLSAAAALLVLGSRLRRDPEALAARAGATSDAEGAPQPVVALPEDEVERLQIPPLRSTGRRIHPEEARSRWPDERAPRPHPPALDREQIGEVAARYHENPTEPAAAELFEASLRHPEELVRVAAASSYLDLTTDPATPLDVLRRALASEDQLTREVAATSLARFVPEDPALARLLVRGQLPEGGSPSTTCLLVHGTWARGQPWWQPGGDFHEYFKAQVRADVYSAADRFSWSGGYSDAARATGAVSLVRWVNDHQLDGLDVVAHSHGGSVAMLATQGGLHFGELVLLSCPVFDPKYLPRFENVGRTISVHVHMDLVILAAGGGQRFNRPEIEEHVVSSWFDHSATHEPDVWEENGVAAFL